MERRKSMSSSTCLERMPRLEQARWWIKATLKRTAVPRGRFIRSTGRKQACLGIAPFQIRCLALRGLPRRCIIQNLPESSGIVLQSKYYAPDDFGTLPNFFYCLPGSSKSNVHNSPPPFSARSAGFVVATSAACLVEALPPDLAEYLQAITLAISHLCSACIRSGLAPRGQGKETCQLIRH